MLRFFLTALLLLALAICPGTTAIGAPPELPNPQPLSARIDSLIESAAIGPLAPICTDADFVRRVYLDLTGVIPTPQQARDFVRANSDDAFA